MTDIKHQPTNRYIHTGVKYLKAGLTGLTASYMLASMFYFCNVHTIDSVMI